MTTPLAIFGITNDTLNTAVQLLLLVLVVIWLALIFYTYADARRRIADPILVGCATAASLFPFVGTVIYMIVRPPEYLADVRERELEVAAAELRLNEMNFQPCPHCDYPVGRDYLRCPSCLRKLRDSCQSCAKPLDPDWRICPYCEAEIAGVTPPPRRRRRTGKTGESDAVRPVEAVEDPPATAPATTSGSSRRRRSSSSSSSSASGAADATAEPSSSSSSRRRSGTTSTEAALKPEEAMAPRRPRTGSTTDSPSVTASESATPPPGPTADGT